MIKQLRKKISLLLMLLITVQLFTVFISIPTKVQADTQTPLTSHPRLWVTSNDLSKLRSWATTSNPMYANATSITLSEAIEAYNTKFYPGGNPNPVWPDNGNSGITSYVTEAYAQFFA